MICPNLNCGYKGKTKKQSRGSVLVGILIVIIIFVFFIILLSTNTEENSQSKKYRPANPQLEKTIQDLISTGAVHSVNAEYNQVRIDPFVWINLPLETKQKTVTLFSQYFESKGSTGRVEILSNRNDKELATYSVWNGIKIIE